MLQMWQKNKNEINKKPNQNKTKRERNHSVHVQGIPKVPNYLFRHKERYVLTPKQHN